MHSPKHGDSSNPPSPSRAAELATHTHSSVFLGRAAHRGAAPTATAILEARKREAALQQRLALESEESFMKNPRTMIAGLTPENMLQNVMLEWKAAEAKAAEENAKAALLGTKFESTALGITEPAFAAIVGAAIQQRFPSLSFEYVAAMLSNLFTQLDAASLGVVSWDTFFSFLMDTADAVLRDAPSQCATSARMQGRAKQVMVSEQDHVSINHVGSLLDVVVRLQFILTEPPLLACLTRSGALHFRDAAAGYAVVVSHKLSGVVSASTFVHNRVLRQTVPGIFAVRSFLVVATSALRMHLFAPKKWELRSTIVLTENVTALRFNDADQFLYSGTRSGDFLLWEVLPKGEFVLRRCIRGIHRGAINEIIFITQYRSVSASSDTTIVECSLGRIVWPVPLKDTADEVLEVTGVEDCSFVFRECTSTVTSLAFCARQRQIIAVCADHSIRAFVESFPSVPADVILHPGILPNTPPIIFISVDPDSSLLFVLDKSTMLRVFDLQAMTQVGSHIIFPQNRALLVFAICASVSPNGNLLINTNASLHVLRAERSTEKESDCILGDSHEVVVAMCAHPVIPSTIIVIASSGVIVWDAAKTERLAWHDNLFNTITSGCVDKSGSRIVVGSAVGQLGVFRLDTGRTIRQYAMPTRTEISAVQFGSLPKLIIAATERHEIILCLDTHENEFGRCPILRLITSAYSIRRLAVCMEQSLYVAVDSQLQCRTFFYDPIDSSVRFFRIGRVSDRIPVVRAQLGMFCPTSSTQNSSTEFAGEEVEAETTSVCPLTPYPAFVVATIDGSISVYATKPHTLGGQCICRWRNRSDLNFDASFCSSSSEASAVSPTAESQSPAVRLVAFHHPYTIVCADDMNRIVLWDLSDVVLQARFVDLTKRNRRYEFFHEVSRPPIVRCVAMIGLPKSALLAGLTLLPPNYIAAVDERGIMLLFSISAAGLTQVRHAEQAKEPRSPSPQRTKSKMSAQQPSSFIRLWKKYVYVFRVLWMLSKYSAALSLRAAQSSAGSVLHLRRSLNVKGIQSSTERAPFRGIHACIIGLNPSPNAPTFLCLSFAWCTDRHLARSLMPNGEGGSQERIAGDGVSMSDLRPSLVTCVRGPRVCCHYQPPLQRPGQAASTQSGRKKLLALRCQCAAKRTSDSQGSATSAALPTPDPLLSQELGVPVDSPSLLKAFSNITASMSCSALRDDVAGDEESNMTDPRVVGHSMRRKTLWGSISTNSPSPRPCSAPPSRAQQQTPNPTSCDATSAQQSGHHHSTSQATLQGTFASSQRSSVRTSQRPKSAASRCRLQRILPPTSSCGCPHTITTFSAQAAPQRPTSAQMVRPVEWSISKDQQFVPSFTTMCPFRISTPQNESVRAICSLCLQRKKRVASLSVVNPSALRASRRTTPMA